MKNYSISKKKIIKAKKKIHMFSDKNLIKYYELFCDIYKH